MSYTPPWPDELRTGPFTVSEAARHGVGRRRANAASVHRPHPLLRAIEPVTSAVDLCQALARTLPPEAAFSHLTAARLWGLPWSSEWSLEEPVHVMLPEGAGRVRRRGIRAHVGLEHRTVTTVKGLRVTSIEDTWGDLTSVDGVTVEDLVVAADAIVC